MKFGRFLITFGFFIVIPSVSQAHVHGVATLDVAIDGSRLTLNLESPLESLLGFERAPRTDEERAAVEKMKAALQGEGQFAPTLEAQCKLTEVKISTPALEAASKKSGEHADLDASYVFQCAQPAMLKDLQVNLFDSFARLTRIKAQIIAPKGQSAATLSRTKRRLTW